MMLAPCVIWPSMWKCWTLDKFFRETFLFLAFARSIQSVWQSAKGRNFLLSSPALAIKLENLDFWTNDLLQTGRGILMSRLNAKNVWKCQKKAMKARSGVQYATLNPLATTTVQTLARDVKVSSRERYRKICFRNTNAMAVMKNAPSTGWLELNASSAD